MIETLITMYLLSNLAPQSAGMLPTELQASVIQPERQKKRGPKKNPELVAPVLKSRAVMAVDTQSNIILFQENAHKRLPVGSLTKLMTAYIVLHENKPDQIATVSREAINVPGSKVWLYPDEKITVGQLLYGMLIPSGNDAARVLAEHNAGTEKTFVEKMNGYAKIFGMHNTRFTNPSGLDHPDNYSTAFDMTILAQKLIEDHNEILDIVKNRTFTIASENGKLKHELKSTNDLLEGYLPVKGLKTGSTPQAGECFIGLIGNEKNPESDILTIVIGSPNRFQETKVLVDWIGRAYQW